MARNLFEEQGRSRKVTRLLAVIDELRPTPTADDVRTWTSATWERATDTANAIFDANMKPPSVATRALVIAEIENRERRAAHRRAS